jgi:hypothetical protein
MAANFLVRVACRSQGTSPWEWPTRDRLRSDSSWVFQPSPLNGSMAAEFCDPNRFLSVETSVPAGGVRGLGRGYFTCGESACWRWQGSWVGESLRWMEKHPRARIGNDCWTLWTTSTLPLQAHSEPSREWSRLAAGLEDGLGMAPNTSFADAVPASTTAASPMLVSPAKGVASEVPATGSAVGYGGFRPPPHAPGVFRDDGCRSPLQRAVGGSSLWPLGPAMGNRGD